jgi:ribosomal protein L29
VSKLKERRKELFQFDREEAQRELAEQRMKLFHLRIQKQRGEVKGYRQFAQARKDVARLLHHIAELDRAAEEFASTGEEA